MPLSEPGEVGQMGIFIQDRQIIIMLEREEVEEMVKNIIMYAENNL